MATLQDILMTKGTEVVSINQDATVQSAAVLMNEHMIGALVVTDRSRVVGMFTERDVLRRVVVPRRDPARTRVAEVMTTEVVCARPQTSIDEARTVMKNRRIRHLPVTNGSMELEGMISIGDLNAYLADAQEMTIHYMQEYIYGRA